MLSEMVTQGQVFFFYVCILWTVIAVVSADCIIKCKQVLAREALVSRGTLVVTEGL